MLPSVDVLVNCARAAARGLGFGWRIEVDLALIRGRKTRLRARVILECWFCEG